MAEPAMPGKGFASVARPNGGRGAPSVLPGGPGAPGGVPHHYIGAPEGWHQTSIATAPRIAAQQAPPEASFQMISTASLVAAYPSYGADPPLQGPQGQAKGYSMGPTSPDPWTETPEAKQARDRRRREAEEAAKREKDRLARDGWTAAGRKSWGGKDQNWVDDDQKWDKGGQKCQAFQGYFGIEWKGEENGQEITEVQRQKDGEALLLLGLAMEIAMVQALAEAVRASVGDAHLDPAPQEVRVVRSGPTAGGTGGDPPQTLWRTFPPIPSAQTCGGAGVDRSVVVLWPRACTYDKVNARIRVFSVGLHGTVQGLQDQAAAGGPFTAGQRVEYRSSGGGWIPAVVQEVHPDGSYKLDCKPRAPADAVRAVAASPRAPAPVSLAFQAEEMVEYFSASQKEWMKARVLAANADGTYDLDCKAGVPESKLRKMLAPTPREASRSAASPRPAAAKFQVGEMVEYFSASQKEWMRAKVTAVRADGMYDLDCKPGVSEDKLRKAGSAPSSAPGSPGTVVGGLGSPGTASPGTVVGGLGTGADGAELGLVPGASYKAGQMVEYFSASQQAWLKAKVLRVHTNGTYDLDCKAGVDAGKIRPLGPPSPGPPTGALRAAGVGSPGTLPGGLGTVTAAALAAGSSSPPPGGGAFGPGQFVEYFSASQQAWMRAKVTALNADGTFNLDCKPNVTQDKIRPLPSVSTQSVVRAAAGAQAGASEAMYKAGQTLEYFSASLQGYMKAKVLRANPDGTYDLDCKAGVPEGKLRGLTAMQERDEVASVASMASSAARVASMQERDKLARVASTASADGGFGEDPANRASLEEAGAASAGDHRLNWPAARSPFEEDDAGRQSVMMRRKSSQPARS
ncbi:unnamed protein product, partial [Prorocentrum cordatum]